MLLGLLVFSSTVWSMGFSLEPQTRLTIGPSWTDGSMGVATSFDSRLTQLVYINIGGFSSFGGVPGTPSTDDPQTWLKLRAGLWASPGIRVPHRYKKDAINWDVIARVGFACLSSSDTYDEDWFLVDPGGLAGADFLLRKEDLGVRISSKMFVYRPYLNPADARIKVMRHHGALEFFKQW